MTPILFDLRHGLRTLLKRPAFTLVAVLTLVLGIGANTAIFSAVNAVLLRELPFESPDRLARASRSPRSSSGPLWRWGRGLARRATSSGCSPSVA